MSSIAPFCAHCFRQRPAAVRKASDIRRPAAFTGREAHGGLSPAPDDWTPTPGAPARCRFSCEFPVETNWLGSHIQVWRLWPTKWRGSSFPVQPNTPAASRLGRLLPCLVHSRGCHRTFADDQKRHVFILGAIPMHTIAEVGDKRTLLHRDRKVGGVIFVTGANPPGA